MTPHSAATPHDCRLISPTDDASWSAYHRIRRTVLFENRGLFGVYDPNRADDRKPGNHAKLLAHGTDCVGVIRIDLGGETAYLRRVAIDVPWQRRGFGRTLVRLAEDFAREHGARRVESAVAAAAVPFYEKCGYRRVAAQGAAFSSVPMHKEL